MNNDILHFRPPANKYDKTDEERATFTSERALAAGLLQMACVARGSPRSIDESSTVADRLTPDFLISFTVVNDQSDFAKSKSDTWISSYVPSINTLAWNNGDLYMIRRYYTLRLVACPGILDMVRRMFQIILDLHGF